MDIDLSELSLKELKALSAKVEKAIETYGERQKREAVAELEAKARELGFSLSELVEAAPKKARAAVQPKYAHPENPSLTWSGRGRQPQWFRDAIDAGRTSADLAI